MPDLSRRCGTRAQWPDPAPQRKREPLRPWPSPVWLAQRSAPLLNLSPVATAVARAMVDVVKVLGPPGVALGGEVGGSSVDK